MLNPNLGSACVLIPSSEVVTPPCADSRLLAVGLNEAAEVPAAAATDDGDGRLAVDGVARVADEGG